MSLSRILNNDTPASQPTSAPSAAVDPAPIDHSPVSGDSPPPRSTTPGGKVAQPRGLSYHVQSLEYEGTGGWNPYNGEYVQGEIFPLGRGGNYYPERNRRREDSVDSTPEDTPGPESGGRAKNGSAEGGSRKKRKTATRDDDADYQPAGQKRYSLRRHPPKNKQYLAASTPDPSVTPEPPAEEHQPTEEELRMASSDLDDCEEVWKVELQDYVIDTHKRQKLVMSWFEQDCLERSSEIARAMSQHYSSRIARIPEPQPIVYHAPDDDSISNARDRSPSVISVEAYEPEYSASGIDHEHRPDAEDVARELEESVLGPSMSKSKGKGKAAAKRPAAGTVSDSSSDLEVPTKKPAAKRRKLDKESGELIADEFERSVSDMPMSLYPPPASALGKVKGKGKMASPDSVSGTSKAGRKRLGPKKKGDALSLSEHLGLGAASISRDGTPASVSRPPSPVATNTSTVFELDEIIPPLKRAKKVDEATMLKRIKNLEEAQRKVWTNIARRDVAKVYNYQIKGFQAREAQNKRTAMLASMQARKPYTRTSKGVKEVQAKGKRMMREMLVMWKKNEKEERDVRKREHKEAADRAKVEEEKREAARQARKLEFLISQTELYSHFVGNKLKTAEIEGEATPGAAVPVGAHFVDVDRDALQEVDFDDADESNLYRHASRNAQDALSMARQKAQQFDKQAALERKTNEAIKLAKAQAHIRDEPVRKAPGAAGAPLVDLDSDELNFQNPTSLMGDLTIAQPKMLNAQLKEYQLKGLNWLGTLYDQGINGILADEMGLGKTVQSISLLAHLAEKHDIWGPFLVVSPASTLHNWQQEITRFAPRLKALPYWGNVKDRATLRKVWGKKEISYNEDAPFHILITSYQLVTQDQQYFQRVKWQYMILDEAQNIKNSSSVRWKTLLGFNCRNRLLLTGTPIQNSMQELWALLHFIMPSLFDSHDEFNEWFSKDIESAAENKGSQLNEHQLRRLHMILKPFMLRRVKRHVQNELSEKIEEDIYVDLSARQRALYKGLLSNMSIAELLERAANIGDVDSARSLMNLVMQFRKVCNHPELFERADVVAPYSFAEFGQSGPLNREGDFVNLPYSTRNPIEYSIPELFYHDGGLLDVPHEDSLARTGPGCLAKLMNIWSTDSIHRSLYDDDLSQWSFLRFLDMSPSEAHVLHASSLLNRRLLAVAEEARDAAEDRYSLDPTFAANSAVNPWRLNPLTTSWFGNRAKDLPELRSISTTVWSASCFSRPDVKLYVPAVVAPPIGLYCRDRSFLEGQTAVLEAPLESLALYGMPVELRESVDDCARYQALLPGLEPVGFVGTSAPDQLSLSNMQVPEAKRLIYDSSKLARLDTLLQELKGGDHRVLIYSQMTRMLDLMEEYLIYRQYKYLRLDGSSKLEDRRDMVIEWQTRPDIFVFLLSTRAGGLGINLTAADTVVFYDHDWNPSNDAQAMDRAHRLGQTRQVTVYRLITRGTIDERIVQLARVKKDVQDIVVGNKTFTDIAKPSEIVQLLLNEDQLANLDTSSARSSKSLGKRPATSAEGVTKAATDIWNDEEDDFFGHTAPAPSALAPESVVEDAGAVPTSTRGRKRKAGTAAAPRGRKPGTRGGGAGSRGGAGRGGAGAGSRGGAGRGRKKVQPAAGDAA